MTQPEFSYVRLKGGTATVTCTCGWGDPLGPMPVSPFDPAEALAAAAATHPHCPDKISSMVAEAPSVDPRRITEQTTLGELAVQRAMLGVSALTLMRDLNGQLTAIVQSTSGLHIGQGATEAAAIDTAFASLRLAMLPAPAESR